MRLSSFGCVNAPRWRPTPIPHKHVNGRGRYMAAVCYTCYRPARTGYVRQSIALILALGAAHTVCIGGGRVHCGAGRPPPLVAAAPLPTRVADPLSPPLFAGTTSPSDYLHLVLCTTLDGATGVDSHSPSAFPKPLSPRVTSRNGLLEKVARLMPRHLALRRARTLFRFSARRCPHRLFCASSSNIRRASVLPEEP